MQRDNSGITSTRTTATLSGKSSLSLSKKHSRITLKLSQLESNIEEQNDEPGSLFALIEVKVNVLLDFDNNEILSYTYQFTDDTPISQVISSAIESFNQEDYEMIVDKKSFRVEFKDDIDYYMLKESKKNNRPKDDYPPYSKDSLIRDINKRNFSLIVKDKNGILFLKYKSQGGNCHSKCIIF